MTYGTSKVAAKNAVLETGITRFCLGLPVMFLPAFGHLALEKLKLWPRNFFFAKTIELFLVCGALTFALPMSIAMFE